MNNWQPIETYQKPTKVMDYDHPRILGYSPTRGVQVVQCIFFDAEYEPQQYAFYFDRDGYRMDDITHWMPLPNAPEELDNLKLSEEDWNLLERENSSPSEPNANLKELYKTFGEKLISRAEAVRDYYHGKDDGKVQIRSMEPETIQDRKVAEIEAYCIEGLVDKINGYSPTVSRFGWEFHKSSEWGFTRKVRITIEEI